MTFFESGFQRSHTWASEQNILYWMPSVSRFLSHFFPILCFVWQTVSCRDQRSKDCSLFGMGEGIVDIFVRCRYKTANAKKDAKAGFVEKCQCIYYKLIICIFFPLPATICDHTLSCLCLRCWRRVFRSTSFAPLTSGWLLMCCRATELTLLLSGFLLCRSISRMNEWMEKKMEGWGGGPYFPLVTFLLLLLLWIKCEWIVKTS